MVLIESENLIVQYVADNDCKVSKNSVVEHMKSDKVEPHLRLAKVAVYNAIDRLTDAKRIRICSEGRRQGQTHYLGIDRTSDFDEINKLISEIDNDIIILDKDYNPTRIKDVSEAIKSYDKVWVKGINHFWTALKILLVRTSKEMNTDTEARICYERITKTMINLSNKEFKVQNAIRMLKEHYG